VRGEDDLSRKENRSYFSWLMGKAPDVVIEFVSDRRGGEDSLKMVQYARAGVAYYVICDPENRLHGGDLRAFELQGRTYRPIPASWFPDVRLGLFFWTGIYENRTWRWLRWCDQQGRLVPTGHERAEQAERERDQERQARERLEAKLRSLGIDPNA